MAAGFSATSAHFYQTTRCHPRRQTSSWFRLVQSKPSGSMKAEPLPTIQQTPAQCVQCYLPAVFRSSLRSASSATYLQCSGLHCAVCPVLPTCSVPVFTAQLKASARRVLPTLSEYKMRAWEPTTRWCLCASRIHRKLSRYCASTAGDTPSARKQRLPLVGFNTSPLQMSQCM
jgi:uncharacterized protein (DUF2237 family)